MRDESTTKKCFDRELSRLRVASKRLKKKTCSDRRAMSLTKSTLLRGAALFPVKAHVWFHLLEDLRRLRGMKYHHESKVELVHQWGMAEDSRSRGMGNPEAKFKTNMQYRANCNQPVIQSIQADVKASRKRNFKQPTQAEIKAVARKEAKVSNRFAVLALPEITEDFASLVELHAVDRRPVPHPPCQCCNSSACAGSCSRQV